MFLLFTVLLFADGIDAAVVGAVSVTVANFDLDFVVFVAGCSCCFFCLKTPFFVVTGNSYDIMVLGSCR